MAFAERNSRKIALAPGNGRKRSYASRYGRGGGWPREGEAEREREEPSVETVEGGKPGRKARDTLPVTGGRDLGKRKGVAIDYLTGRPRWILVCDSPEPALAAAAFRTKRRRALSPLGTRTKAKVDEPEAYTYGFNTRAGSRTPAILRGRTCTHSVRLSHGPPGTFVVPDRKSVV